jgi:hypothetical protein
MVFAFARNRVRVVPEYARRGDFAIYSPNCTPCAPALGADSQPRFRREGRSLDPSSEREQWASTCRLFRQPWQAIFKQHYLIRHKGRHTIRVEAAVTRHMVRVEPLWQLGNLLANVVMGFGISASIQEHGTSKGLAAGLTFERFV